MPIRLFSLGLLLFMQGQDAPLFNDADRSAVVSYWSQPGRYDASPFEDPKGPWVVRLTPEGSKWLWSYNKARGLSKTNPEAVVGAQNPDQVAWQKWIDARIAFDRYQAAQSACQMNAAVRNQSLGVPDLPLADDPGPAPEGLSELMGEPPPFAVAVKPYAYTVAFDDGTTLRYTDEVSVPTHYASFRWPEGVDSIGTPVSKLPVEDMERLSKAAGLDDTERKVMAAISPLEGGFDSINTYDTGFVSVGFIQFACLKAGAGTLGAVLAREKRDNPDAFASDFRKYGVDVQPSNRLDCLDPATGIETFGADAAKEMIADKRLIAVFQRAGQQSDAFRIAQLETAKEMFYPANDSMVVACESGTMSCRVCDVVKSEAGLAILMDRKVNTGNLNPLPSVLSEVMEETGAKTPDELAAHEREIVEALVYRRDFLGDLTLSQPQGPSRLDGSVASRHGTRKPRGSKGGNP